jgi:hypothetical protein
MRLAYGSWLLVVKNVFGKMQGECTPKPKMERGSFVSEYRLVDK